MAYCPHCGKEILNEAVVCIHCGCQTKPDLKPMKYDAPNIGYGILGFFVPVVGLILYLIWRDETPLRAKSAGKGALIRVIVDTVFGIVFFIFYMIIITFAIRAGINS